jgi:DegV family protein with EDD domain
MRIALVTDSTADIPVEILRAHQINVVPNLVIIEGKSLIDGKDISRQEFYEQLPEMNSPPTTSTASSGTYQETYERLLSQGASHIISLHASSLLSGIFNAASAAAQAFSDSVKVLDSEQISLGLGYQVIAAAEAIAKGASLESVLGMIQDVRQRVRVIAMLDTLEYVRRSGRVSWARARLGNLLRVKPFLEVRDGQVFSLGDTRTRRKGIERLKDFLLSLGPLERLAVLHTNAEADARQFLEDLSFELSYKPFIVNVTTVIGTHVGPNGLGFAAVVE